MTGHEVTGHEADRIVQTARCTLENLLGNKIVYPEKLQNIFYYSAPNFGIEKVQLYKRGETSFQMLGALLARGF